MEVLSGDNKNTNSKGLSLKPILSVLVYVNFTLTSIKEINSVEELPPASGPVGKLNGGGRVQLTLGGTTLGRWV